MPHPDYSSNIILIICGPAGSGKTTLCDRLLKEFAGSITRLVTTTSRQPRKGEVDGVDYHFLTDSEFEKAIEQGDFMEWAKVHGRYYGSRKSDLECLLHRPSDILLNIDVQGADAFYRQSLTNPVLRERLHRVFIRPRSISQLIERMKLRGTDNEAEIQRRLESARQEIKVADSFEHIIISGTKDEDYAAIRRLYLSLRTPK